MRRSIFVFLALLALLGAAGCGVIEAARDAGEKAAGGDAENAAKGARENAPGPTDRPGEAEPRASGTQEASAESPDEGGEATSAGEQAQATAEMTEGAAAATAAEPVLDEKWYQDSDGNYVPDFVEVDKGYDPDRDDCAVKGNCPGGEGIDFYTEPRNALLVLDSSGSMAAGDGTGTGRTKMEAAKEALLRYSGPSSVVFDTGFAVFGHTGDATRAGKAESCREAAELLAPLGEVDPATFEGTLARFQPTGWTPIEGALREAQDVFAGHEGETNRVTLVSDGIETCGGDPVAAAEELHRSGIEVRIDVVGFGVPDDESEQLEAIATAGGGEYFDARTGADLDGYFARQADAMGKTVDAATCHLNAGFSAINCDLGLCNEAVFDYIEPEQLKHDYGDARWRAFDDLIDRIYAGEEEREKAYNESIDQGGKLLDQYDRMLEEYNRAMQQAYGGA